MKAHVAAQDTTPLLIFPEGTCVNNEYCVMFKRGAFDLDATVCPIAIKYNKIFVDAFWNSRRQSFTAHLVRSAPALQSSALQSFALQSSAKCPGLQSSVKSSASQSSASQSSASQSSAMQSSAKCPALQFSALLSLQLAYSKKMDLNDCSRLYAPQFVPVTVCMMTCHFT